MSHLPLSKTNCNRPCFYLKMCVLCRCWIQPGLKDKHLWVNFVPYVFVLLAAVYSVTAEQTGCGTQDLQAPVWVVHPHTGACTSSFFPGLGAPVPPPLPSPPHKRTDNTSELLCVEIRYFLVAVLNWRNCAVMAQKWHRDTDTLFM